MEKYGKYGNHWEWMEDIYAYIWDINGEFMEKITFLFQRVGSNFGE